MNFRAVLLDFYGTLASAVAGRVSVHELAEKRGHTLQHEVLYRWSVDALDGTEHLEHSTSRDAYGAFRRERRRQALAECGVGPDDLEPLLDDMEGQDAVFAFEAYAEVPGVLAELRARGLRLAICSNWDWDLDRAIEASGLSGLVDFEISSARVGARKPHPRIYTATLDAVGVEPAEALFVGDTWGPDVEGPLAAGMTPVHLVREGDDRYVPRYPDEFFEQPGVHRITDLRGLLDLV